MGLLKKLFGTSSEKELRAIKPIVDKIEALDGGVLQGSDRRAAQGQDRRIQAAPRQTARRLDDILPEAFATCREAAWPRAGHAPLPGAAHRRHRAPPGPHRRDEDRRRQDPGGHPARLPQRPGRQRACTSSPSTTTWPSATASGWARSTASWASPWAWSIHDMPARATARPPTPPTSPTAPTTSWASTTCGTTWPSTSHELVQRGHAFAIVDEVDSILIDEARTPLIISGQGREVHRALHRRRTSSSPRLKKPGRRQRGRQGGRGRRHGRRLHRGREGPHRHPHRPGHRQGRAAVFSVENLADPENTTLSHHINQAIRARGVMQRDIDYVVKDGEVIIVDEFTGRLMYGRRYNEGLHQAIEAKEGVDCRPGSPRPWPPSPSRTTSACTASSPA